MTTDKNNPPTLPLTPRELQVLVLVANGKHNNEIATLMGITEHTAKFHVNQILAKTEQSTRLGAVIFCLKHGIIKLDSLMQTVMPDVIGTTPIHASIGTKEENDNLKANLLEDIMESVDKLSIEFDSDALKMEIKEALNVYFPT